MSLHFSGITFYSGPNREIQKKLDERQTQDCFMLSAQVNGLGVALDGEDSAVFMKQQFDIEMPREFKQKSTEETVELAKSNLAKYLPFFQKIQEAMALNFTQDAFRFAQDALTKGQDAEGNPVQEQTFTSFGFVKTASNK
jgi:hypothetical protein